MEKLLLLLRSFENFFKVEKICFDFGLCAANFRAKKVLRLRKKTGVLGLRKKKGVLRLRKKKAFSGPPKRGCSTPDLTPALRKVAKPRVVEQKWLSGPRKRGSAEAKKGKIYRSTPDLTPTLRKVEIPRLVQNAIPRFRFQNIRRGDATQPLCSPRRKSVGRGGRAWGLNRKAVSVVPSRARSPLPWRAPTRTGRV